jgi:hypothetical protein
MLIALAVVACAGPPPAGYEFPRHRGFGFGGPTALLDGVLEVRDGCLYVRSENGYATYVVWPAGYSLRVDGDSVAVYDGWSLRYRPGDRVTEGGGWYDDTTFVKERLVEGTLPAACPTDEYMMSTGHFEPPHP